MDGRRRDGRTEGRRDGRTDTSYRDAETHLKMVFAFSPISSKLQEFIYLGSRGFALAIGKQNSFSRKAAKVASDAGRIANRASLACFFLRASTFESTDWRLGVEQARNSKRCLEAPVTPRDLIKSVTSLFVIGILKSDK